MTHSVPPVWFRLPPGFYDIGPADRTALNDVADALGSPDARQQLDGLMDGLDELAGHHVVHTSIGIHPDDPEGIVTSLFSLTVRPAEHSNPRVSVARIALSVAGSALWNGSKRRFIDLASKLPCCLVAGVISVPGIEGGLFQARVVTAHPESRHVLVLDLTSAATEHADAYTTILEAVTHTLGFSDPRPQPPTAAGTSRIFEVLL